MRQDAAYRLAHAAAIKPAGPAPMTRMSACDFYGSGIIVFPRDVKPGLQFPRTKDVWPRASQPAY